MRTFLIAVLVAIAALPASAATRNFGVNGFDQVRIEGPYAVDLTTGVAPFAKATGSQAGLDRVAIRVEGRTLQIRAAESWGGYPGQDGGPVTIQVGTHDLAGAFVLGAGTLHIDKVKGLQFNVSVQGSGGTTIDKADVDQLGIVLGGTASVRIAGRAGKLTTAVRGMSMLDASGLAAKDAGVAAEGTATIKANVTNSVKLEAAGPSTISFEGRPSCISRLKGSASVSGCR
jgi:hypothetical protein